MTSTLPPGRLGGAEKYALQLAERLSAAGVTVDIAACNPSGRDFRVEHHGHGDRFLLASPLHSYFGFLVSASQWLRASAAGYDVVQFFDMNHLTAVGLWATRQSGRCRIARVEGVLNWSDEQLGRTRLPLLGGWARRWLLKADRYVVVSRSEVEALAARGVESACIEFIPNGVDVAGMPASAVPREPVIVCPARLREEKNHLELLEAFALVRQRVAEARLVLPGDGPMAAPIAARVRELGLQDAVLLPGHVDDMAGLVSASRCAALLSVAEGPALGILEAAACGRPAVVSRVGGLVDSVVDGRTGLVVELHDIEAAAEALTRILTDDSLAQHFGDEAARFVREERSLDIVAGRYLEYLRRCAEAC